MAKKRKMPAMIEVLRERIQATGRSQRDLATEAGLDHTSLSRFVRGDRGLSFAAAARLSEILGLRLVAEPQPPTKRKGKNPSR